MIRCIIIDDEQFSRSTLELLISKHCPDVELLDSCEDPEKGLEAITRLKPDLVFLDIEMPRMNGFDLLERVKQFSFRVIFTTAYNQFAIKAIKYSALSYLLKPIDPGELKEAVQRMKDTMQQPFQQQIELLMQQLQHQSKRPQRIALSTGDGLVFVQTDDILYCQADSNYTHVVLGNGEKMLLAKSLKEFEDTLAGDDFFRIHNSYLVNLNKIKKFVRGEGGYVIMNNGTQITIARARRDEFFALFEKF